MKGISRHNFRQEEKGKEEKGTVGSVVVVILQPLCVLFD